MPAGLGFSFLSWDTEGNVQTKLNLLRAGATGVFQVRADGKWVEGRPFAGVSNATDGTTVLGGAGCRGDDHPDTFSPWRLPAPKGVDEAAWKGIRRGWWNALQPMVHGERISLDGCTFKTPAGVLSNNPISDSCSGLYPFDSCHVECTTVRVTTA